MKKRILVYGTNTVPFINKMRDQYGITKHLYDYVLIIDDKVQLMSDHLEDISMTLDGNEVTMLTKSEFVNQ